MSAIRARSVRAAVALAVVAAAFVLPGGADAATTPCVQYSDFSSTAGLNLLGAASQNGSALELTPNAFSQAGAAYTASKVAVGRGFRADFRFRMATFGADGLAFVINNATSTLIPQDPDSDPTGSGLGYDGIHNSVVVEFDSYQSDGDPNANHVAVHANSGAVFAGSANIGATKELPITLDDGDPHDVKITYRPRTRLKRPRLVVALDGQTVLTTSKIDLKRRLGLVQGEAWLGLTAATGGEAQQHLIESWTVGCRS